MRPGSAIITFLLVVGASRGARADSVGALAALTAPASDGGTAITIGEANGFAAAASGLSADDAILGIVAAGGLRAAGNVPSDIAYTTIVRALRFRVDGLAVSLRQAPGVTFSRSPSDDLAVAMDPRGVSYSRVDIAYSFDGWTSSAGATLAPRDGIYRARLPNAPATGRVVYAMHLFGPDGTDVWINNPRELGIYGGQGHLDFSLDLAAAATTQDAPSSPALVALLDDFTDPASPGGTTITNTEFSLLVEEITWEGGTGVEERRVLVPVLDELFQLEHAGAVFESGVLDNMRAFVHSAILPTASFPASFQRDTDGALRMQLFDDAASAKLWYSTDGWDLPHVADCHRSTANAPLACSLGYLPPDALMSYTIELVDADGSVHWQRSVLGNFFAEIPQ